jgi:hypothetical protein
MNSPDNRISPVRRWGAILAVSAVAVAAVVITVRFRARPATDARQTGPQVMAALRGFQPPGWQVTEVPLGPNELSEQIVNKILRFDDAAFLQFRNGSRDFAVYIAYWGPGKADMRTVNAHTPDTCWVNSGWQTREKRSGFTGFGLSASLPSGEYRCYSNQGTVQYVAFWHMLAGRPVKMWRNGFPTLDFMWSVFRGNRETLSGEQYFIRISSSRSLEEIWSDPAFAELLDRLGATGLSPHAVAAI